jgi:hypothetical protein
LALFTAIKELNHRKSFTIHFIMLCFLCEIIEPVFYYALMENCLLLWRLNLWDTWKRRSCSFNFHHVLILNFKRLKIQSRHIIKSNWWFLKNCFIGRNCLFLKLF